MSDRTKEAYARLRGMAPEDADSLLDWIRNNPQECAEACRAAAIAAGLPESHGDTMAAIGRILTGAERPRGLS